MMTIRRILSFDVTARDGRETLYMCGRYTYASIIRRVHAQRIARRQAS